MGLFNGYTKEGKGVDKNEPKKKGAFLFLDIIIHKFSKLMGANCLLTLTSILWIAALYIFSAMVLINTNLAETLTSAIVSADSTIDVAQAQGSITVMLQLMISVGIFILWGSGPSSAAYAYISRCLTRGEPVWVASDGKDKFVENFKQGMVVVLIDAVVLVMGVNAALFYHSFYASAHSFIWLMLIYILVIAFVIYTFMHPYMYQLMITFECSVAEMYKKALIMAIAKLPVNVFITAVCMGVIILLFNLVNPILAALILGTFGLCVTRFASDFCAARVIEKNILKNMKKKAAEPVIEYLDEEDASE